MRKSWTFPDYPANALMSLFDQALSVAGDDSSSLVSPDGKALHVRARHPADVATLPVAAFLCHQYLQLKDGDIALLNDPFTGGTQLSDVTLVAGCSFESESSDVCDLLIARRISFSPRISFENRMDDEGVRLPPMPLVSGGQANREILAAIAAAPQAPHGLAAALDAAITDLGSTRAFLKACGRDPHSEFRKTSFKRYLDQSRDATRLWMTRLPLGEARLTSFLESGELLKLRLEVIDDKVTFDFTGSEPSTRVQLTDLATFGACFAAVEGVLGRSLPANAGSFQLVQVLAPTRTWMNAKSPAATGRGVSDGLAAISALAVRAFGQLSSPHRAGQSAVGSCRLRFDFADGRSFTDATAGGTGARAELPGLDGVHPWLDRETRRLSVEQAESIYPIQIRSVVLRPGSGGKGKWPGGMGMVKTYSVLEPSRVSWALEQVREKPEGAEGGKAGLAPEITVARAGSLETEELPTAGQTDLNPGDLLHIHTAGGGGFGAAEPSSGD